MNFLGQAENITTKFRDKELDDPIDYRVNIRSMNENENIPDRYKNKPREIVERDAISSFRINGSQLKKHVNPSDIYEEELKKQQNYIKSLYNINNTTINSNINNNNSNNNNNNNKLYEFSQNYENGNTNLENINKMIQSIPPGQPVSSQLLHVIDYKLNNLQQETKLKYEDKNEPYTPINYFKEKDVQTQFLTAENGVVQVLKHVTTQRKPEYMSLEEVQKEREENAKKLIELEQRYKNAKQKELMKEIEDKDKMNKKFNYNPEILEELKNILEKENELFNFEKKNKRYKKKLNKTYKENEIVKNPINKKQEEYVKQYAKYVIKKKIDEEEKDELNLQNKEWNQTRILSKNINGVVNRNDELPGYMGKEDYQMYYYDIKDERKEDLGKFKAPHWGVVNKKNINENL